MVRNVAHPAKRIRCTMAAKPVTMVEMLRNAARAGRWLHRALDPRRALAKRRPMLRHGARCCTSEPTEPMHGQPEMSVFTPTLLPLYPSSLAPDSSIFKDQRSAVGTEFDTF